MGWEMATRVEKNAGAAAGKEKEKEKEKEKGRVLQGVSPL